jgi:hypothetical protein
MTWSHDDCTATARAERDDAETLTRTLGCCWGAEQTSEDLGRARRRKKRKAEIGQLEEEEAERRRSLKRARAALQEDMSVLLMEEQEFPEVLATMNEAVGALTAGAAVSLSREVMVVLDLSMSLAAFEERQVLSSLAASRHVVYKVREGERWFALKEYVVADARELATSLREAALLRRLKHPAVAELSAVLLDTRDVPKLYLQMPLYVNGQLHHWIMQRAPAWWLVRQAIVDVLGGLEFLHEMQVVRWRVPAMRWLRLMHTVLSP